jgi:hypothetical protein
LSKIWITNQKTQHFENKNLCLQTCALKFNPVVLRLYPTKKIVQFVLGPGLPDSLFSWINSLKHPNFSEKAISIRTCSVPTQFEIYFNTAVRYFGLSRHWNSESKNLRNSSFVSILLLMYQQQYSEFWQLISTYWDTWFPESMGINEYSNQPGFQRL